MKKRKISWFLCVYFSLYRIRLLIVNEANIWCRIFFRISFDTAGWVKTLTRLGWALSVKAGHRSGCEVSMTPLSTPLWLLVAMLSLMALFPVFYFYLLRCLWHSMLCWSAIFSEPVVPRFKRLKYFLQPHRKPMNVTPLAPIISYVLQVSDFRLFDLCPSYMCENVSRPASDARCPLSGQLAPAKQTVSFVFKVLIFIHHITDHRLSVYIARVFVLCSNFCRLYVGASGSRMSAISCGSLCLCALLYPV